MPVLQFTKSGNYINEFESVKAAGKAVGGFPGDIARVAKGIKKSCKGFVWKFKTN